VQDMLWRATRDLDGALERGLRAGRELVSDDHLDGTNRFGHGNLRS